MSQAEDEQSTSREACPAAFFWLQPLGAAGIFFQSVLICMTLLHTQDLALKTPNTVLFMPWLLQYASPDVIAANMLGLSSLATGILSPVSGMVSVHCGLKATNNMAGLVIIIGTVLMAMPRFYLVGLWIGTLGMGFFGASQLALFTSQWDEPRQAQRLISYNYALINVTGFISSTLAGFQTFPLLCAEIVAIMCVGLLSFRLAPMRFRDKPLEAAQASSEPLSACELARVRAFGVLVIFMIIFNLFTFQFLGGAFFIFVEQELGTIGSRPVPPSLFLAWAGVVDVLLAVFVMDRLHGPSTKFYTKLQLAFLFLALASGLLAAVVTIGPGSVSPVFAFLSITLLAFGDMHFSPVIMTVISQEMPERYVGVFTGVIFVVSGVSGFLGAGLGVLLYLHVGSAMYFGILSAMAATGLLGLGLLRPYLGRKFQARVAAATADRPGQENAGALSCSLVNSS